VPWKPSVPGEVPTLGYYAIDWLAAELNSPDDPSGSPLRLTREQEEFTLRWYEIDPETCRFRRDRGLIGRSRGWGKSPFLGALAILEALADIVPDGWDADGQPVGRPWSRSITPLIDIAAASEAQTNNTWLSMLDMLSGPVIDDYPGLEPMDTKINLPVGAIERITASSRTVKGRRTPFVVLDQTEEWVKGNGGVRLAQTLRTNARKVGGRTLESPNAFIPGEGSVAEQSAAYAKLVEAGKVRGGGRLLYDHREAPADTDLTDMDSLIAGLRFAYGCSSNHPQGCVLHDPPCPPGWAPIDSNAAAFRDPTEDVQQLRSDFLNQVTHATDSWITRPDWNARAANVVAPKNPPSLAAGDVITLGFDGSRRRKRGMTDATALVACRVSDGLLVLLNVWEQPDGPAGDDWAVPVDEVNAAVDEAFAKYSPVGFYADPSKWETSVAAWEAKYGARLKVKASRQNPIEWWMTGGRGALITRMLDAFLDAVLDGELTHTAQLVLTQHVLNSRRRNKTTGYQIYKEHPDSPNKIDAAIAAVLAWQARVDALGAGHGRQRTTRGPRRIR